ncbi:MAG: phenylalanine--tRNA ligase subunit beta, partial [Acidobacteria bacterium]
TLPDAVTFEQVEEAVHKLRIAELRNFTPVEIFRGGNISAGRYSLLARARLHSAERTLRDDEIARWSDQIVKALGGLGGTLRS